MRHIPHLKDLSRTEIESILAKAQEIKANPGDFTRVLSNQTLAMLFQKTSTRTRVSFEVAMTELGGHGVFIDWQTSNFVLSGIDYETEYLSRNVGAIMARLLKHADLEEIIRASQVPVINGCCEKFHPCQSLTDVLTMREHFEGDLGDAHLVFVGVQNNVSNSLTLICDKLDINGERADRGDRGQYANTRAARRLSGPIREQRPLGEAAPEDQVTVSGSVKEPSDQGGLESVDAVAPGGSGSRRVASLTGIRAVAAILVVLTHAAYMTGKYGQGYLGLVYSRAGDRCADLLRAQRFPVVLSVGSRGEPRIRSSRGHRLRGQSSVRRLRLAPGATDQRRPTWSRS